VQDKPEQQQARTAATPYATDRELAPILRVSVGFLQKDRIGAQRIPFVRLGDRCLYDIDEALAAVKAMTVGGARSRRGRNGSGAK
jgi:hypothetical protein